MDFINDAIVSMDALVSAYKPATVFFLSPVEIRYPDSEQYFLVHDLSYIVKIYKFLACGDGVMWIIPLVEFWFVPLKLLQQRAGGSDNHKDQCSNEFFTSLSLYFFVFFLSLQILVVEIYIFSLFSLQVSHKVLFPSIELLCLCSYGNEELLGTLVKLHDSLLPSLKRGFQMILTSGEDGMTSNIGVSLKMLSMRISNFGCKLLEFCYLSDEVFKDNLPIPAATKMFPANVEDPVIRADILVQTFREISEVSLHKEENQNWETFLRKVEKNFCIMRKIENLRKTGKCFQHCLHYLSKCLVIIILQYCIWMHINRPSDGQF